MDGKDLRNASLKAYVLVLPFLGGMYKTVIFNLEHINKGTCKKIIAIMLKEQSITSILLSYLPYISTAGAATIKHSVIFRYRL